MSDLWLSVSSGDVIRVDVGHGQTRRMRVVSDPELDGDVVRFQVVEDEGRGLSPMTIQLMLGGER